jgi:hypothetical protein
MEVNACLEKLNEIDSKLEKGISNNKSHKED